MKNGLNSQLEGELEQNESDLARLGLVQRVSEFKGEKES